MGPQDSGACGRAGELLMVEATLLEIGNLVHDGPPPLLGKGGAPTPRAGRAECKPL
jgi:hypothetical protein